MTRCSRDLALYVAFLILIPQYYSDAAGSTTDYVVRVWETDQGLPENSATAMVQDTNGFLWFGTFNGLVRFDGIEFEIFDRSNLAALPSPAVINLHFDQSNRLWVSTMEGLIARDGETWIQYGEEDGWVGNYVRSFAESPEGVVYAATFDGKLLKLQDGLITPLAPPPGTKEDGLIIYSDSNGYLWAIDSEFFGFREGEIWIEAKASRSFEALSLNYSMAPSSEGNTWVIDSKYLWLLSRDQVVNQIELPPGCHSTWSIYEDSTQRVWIASWAEGLFIYDRANSEWSHFTSNDLLSHNSLRFAFEDQEGKHWVGSSGGGLMQFHEPRFTSYGVQEDLSEPLVKSVTTAADGRVFAATFGGGVNVLEHGKFRQVEVNHTNSVFVQSVLLDTKQQLWAGMFEEGLLKSHGSNETLSYLTEYANRDFRASFEDSHGSVWLGSVNSVIRFLGETSKVLAVPPPVRTEVTAFAQRASSEEVYIGTSSSGVFRSDGESIVRYPIDDRFDQEGVASLLFLNDRELLIGTFDLGLIVHSNKGIVQLDQSRDFPGSGISSLTLHDEDLWIGTNKGIVRMAQSHLRKMIDDQSVPFLGQVFTQSDGLSSIECPMGFQPTAAKDHQGRLWFASGKGVNSIDPSRLQLNQVELSIVFDKLIYEDSAGQRQTVIRESPDSVVVLPPDHSNLIIEFTSPSFASPEKIEFETVLTGPRHRIVNRQSNRDVLFHRLEPGDYELSIRARNGDGIWSRKIGKIQLSVSPFYWQKPEFRASVGAGIILLTGAIGFWISRRLMTREMKFIQSERQLKNLLEQTQQTAFIGGWEYDTKTKQLYWTKEAYSIHETRPDTITLDLERFYQFYQSSDQINLRAAIESAAKRGTDFELEVQTHPHNVWLRITGKVIESPSRKIYGCFQNIQQQKNKEQIERDREKKVRQSQKLEAMGTLAGGIAHDFNNILTGIRGYADLLALDLPQGSKSRENVRELQDAANRATDLVKQILTYSRPSSEKLVPLKLLNVCRHALKLIRASIPSSIEIETSLPPRSPLVAGSESQIHQLLVNLFTNSAQAIGDLGTIYCSLRTEIVTQAQSHPLGDLNPGAYAIVEIRDTGKGIEKEVLEKIFDPFFTTKQDTAGTGLGLSVVFGIVNSHRGAIRLTSSKGEGTTFRVYFPCIGNQEEATPIVSSHPQKGQGQRIMLIDDDQAVIRVTARMIERLGYTCEPFMSSSAAIDVFELGSNRYSLVITDLTMPTMRGEVVIKELRKRNARIPIILASGNLDGKNPESLDPSVNLYWLQKPFKYNELADVISLAINESQANDGAPNESDAVPFSPLPSAPHDAAEKRRSRPNPA